MRHQTHSYPMIGLLVFGAVLFFFGAADGGALVLLWLLACVGMMVAMMWAMSSRQHGAEHTHDDADHRHGDTDRKTRSHQ